MAKVSSKTREEARRLFLTGEIRLNSEIAARLGVKAHTVDLWRRPHRASSMCSWQGRAAWTGRRESPS